MFQGLYYRKRGENGRFARSFDLSALSLSHLRMRFVSGLRVV